MSRKHHRGVLEGHAHCVFAVDSRIGHGNIRTVLCSYIRVIIHLSCRSINSVIAIRAITVPFLYAICRFHFVAIRGLFMFSI